MKKKAATDGKKAAANDKPENGTAEKAKVTYFAEDRPIGTRAVHNRLNRNRPQRLLEGVLRLHQEERNS